VSQQDLIALIEELQLMLKAAQEKKHPGSLFDL
jgi:hypothetical protein